jgi:hypothetical protein
MARMEEEAIAKKLALAEPNPSKLHEANATALRQLLERYHRENGVAINIPVIMISHEAARVTTPSSVEKNRPIDNLVRFWQAEALSYFEASAWEGELRSTLLIGYVPYQIMGCNYSPSCSCFLFIM